MVLAGVVFYEEVCYFRTGYLSKETGMTIEYRWLDSRLMSVQEKGAVLRDVPVLLAQLSDRPVRPLKTEAVYEILARNQVVTAWEYVVPPGTPHHRVATDTRSRIVGVAILVPVVTFGGLSGLVEEVMVHSDVRSQGIGRQLMTRLIERARERHMRYLDLTSSPKRIEANAFYPKLGFGPRKTNPYRLDL